MRLQDCDFNIDVVMGGRLIHDRPEGDWVQDHESGAIPTGLFCFYHAADYFSFDKTPPFLADTENLLYSYLGNLVLASRGSLRTASRLRDEIADLNAKMYTPYKSMAGQAFERDAGSRQMSSYKYFVIEISSLLDILAEVSALMFPGKIPKLTIGRASFPVLRAWLEDASYAVDDDLVSPRGHELQSLHQTLRPLFKCEGTEKDWSQLLQLHRNKLAHLGGATFPAFLLADKDKEFHAFLPRRWPFIPQKFMKQEEHGPEADLGSTQHLLEEHMVHVDLIELSAGMFERVWAVLDAGFDSLADAYKRLRDFEYDPVLLERFLRQEERCSFTSFEEGC
jgi:hypothetical protein